MDLIQIKMGLVGLFNCNLPNNLIISLNLNFHVLFFNSFKSILNNFIFSIKKIALIQIN